MNGFIAKISALAALASLAAPSASANLARSAISSYKLTVYGMYVTSDATCQTGLISTLPISGAGQTIDLTTTPTLGSGVVPSSVACVVMVVQNAINITYSSGNYSGTDAVCNAGGSLTVNPCNNGKAVNWVSQVANDMSAHNLKMVSSCTLPTGNEVVPVYLSANAACTGNSTIDALLGQTGCAPDGFTNPTTANSTTAGLYMGGSTGQSAYAFVADPDQTVGAQGGACASVSPPRFGARGGASTSAVASGNASSPTIIAVKVGGALAETTTAGGGTLTVTGTGFSPSATVGLGSSACKSPTVTGTNQVTCTIPAGTAGLKTVTVTNVDTGLNTSLSNGFEYRSAPTITSISPTHIVHAAGIHVTVNGTGFRNNTVLGDPTSLTGTQVTFGKTGTTLNCTSVAVTGGNASGTGSLAANCTVTAPAIATGLAVTMTNSPDATNTATRAGTVATGLNFD